MEPASNPPTIEGVAETGWEPVRAAFARNFAEHGDRGAAVTVLHHGQPVVDLWAGVADSSTGRAWDRDTPVLVFSCTKGVAAALVWQLAESGRLAIDGPVADVWPEFCAAAKGAVTIRQVLTHQVGLPIVEGDWTLEQVFEPGRVAAQLATQAPIWDPGTQFGYHARTYGWLVGEIVLRVTGMSFGEHLRSVVEPLGLDIWVGTPPDVQQRLAEVYPDPLLSDPETKELMEDALAGDSMMGQVLSGPSNLFSYDAMWNRPDLLAAEMPSSNGVATARGLAGFYAATMGHLDSPPLLSTIWRDAARAVQNSGTDVVLNAPARFASGFMMRPMLNPSAPLTAMGHPGAGGSVAFGDHRSGIAFAYTPNQMRLGLSGDERSAGLIDAVFECVP